MTAWITSMCLREATSGKTPPYWACKSVWLAMMLLRIVRPFSTTAAAVSSQEVSIARIRVNVSDIFSTLCTGQQSGQQRLFLVREDGAGVQKQAVIGNPADHRRLVRP